MSTYEPPSQQALSWVAENCAGTEILQVERLFGGITADMDRIDVRGRDGRPRRVVLRRWRRDWEDVDAAVDREAAALRALQGQPVAAPHLLATDRSGEQVGASALLMTEVPGRVELAPADLDPWLEELAATLVSIHDLPPTLTTKSSGWFDPDHDRDWITDPGLRRDALALASGDNSEAPKVLTHGDYQHFNLLWTEGRISGVVDWTSAGVGPRGVDVGHCRLNLAVLFSAEAAQTFLDRYQAIAGERVDPVSDLRGLLQWAPAWKEFIPVQVAGRAPLDLSGMRDRVVNTIRASLARNGR